MISEAAVKKYCLGDISLIENYQEAISDQTQTWECHHRLECVDGVFSSPTTLKEKGLYYGRPASELIFLTKAEHNALHNKDPKMIENMRKSLIKVFANPLIKSKMRESHLGKRNAMFGKTHSEEARAKIIKASRGAVWWNNGIINTRAKEQPGPDFVRGMKK